MIQLSFLTGPRQINIIHH